MTAFHPAVPLRELLGDPELGLEELWAAPQGSVGRDLVLVGDVDDILDVPPDGIVLVPEEVALGGWTVSVALRYAWERRASALIVPAQAYPGSVVDLARRFGIGLFATHERVGLTALEVSRALGRRTAGRLAELDSLGAAIREADRIEVALRLLSEHLGGALIEIAADDLVLVRHGARRSDAAAVLVDLGPRSPLRVRALVERAARDFAERALGVAAPMLRALLAEEDLRRDRLAAPLLGAAALGADRPLAMLGDMGAGVDALRDLREDDGVVVCLRPEPIELAERLGPAVALAWRSAFRSAPLGRAAFGWLSFLPSSTREGGEQRTALLDRIGPAMRSLGIAIGVSSAGFGSTARSLVSQAWLAARVASADGVAVEFERIARRLVGRAFPAEDARRLAELYFPRLLEEPQRLELAEGVVAYLACGGSATAAAAHLGVHRNTIQARLRRASELGLELDEPENLLAVHLLLDGLIRAERGGPGRRPGPVFPST